jgi:porin
MVAASEAARRPLGTRIAVVVACALLVALAPRAARAQINPWIANSVYNPEEWDSAGPETATPWLHPPTYLLGQGFGILPPDSALAGGRWHKLTNLTGSWGGVRDRLMERGIAVSLAYFGQLSANPVGGIREGGTTWRGDAAAGVFADLERVAGWRGTYFTASADWKAGTRSLTDHFIGNQLPVQLDNGDDGGATRLVNLAVGKQIFGDRAEIVAGRVVTGEEFATLRLPCTSLNQGICGIPLAAAQSISFPTFPNAVWGGHFKLKPGTGWSAQAGSYLVFPGFRDPSFHGTNFSAPDGSGALSLAQIMYLTGGAGTRHKTLPGRYILGGYFDSERVTAVETQQPVHGTGGAYLLGEQMLFAERPGSNVGLSAWLALSWAPPNRNPVSNMAAGGLVYQGIVPGRPWDGLAFVAAWAGYSDELRDGQRARGEPLQHGEVLLELNYRLSLAHWLWLQPDVQGVIQPKGRSDIPDAIAIGFAFGVVL